MPGISPDSSIKAPTSIRTMIGISVPILFLFISARTNTGLPPFLHYFRLLWIIASIVAFLFVLVNALKKAGKLKWASDTLMIRSRRISGKEIKAIYIDGPLVGILPEGKRIVPVNLCFRFIEDREENMSRLIKWAESNGIRLNYKRFVKWL